MKIIDFDLTNVPNNLEPMNLCLGYFDGMHLGHQKIISEAKKNGGPVGVFTFNTSPHIFIGRDSNKRCLTSVDERAFYSELYGVDYLLVMPFDEEIMATSRLDFVNNVLKILKPKSIYCGEDYHFGKDALGTPIFLSHYFETHTVNLVQLKDKKISSRTIRELIGLGDIKSAIKLMGHYYRIGGYVVSGERNGRTIGFPTANLDLDFPYVMPKEGVYMGFAYIRDAQYLAMICIGTHPTFGALQIPIVEVHIIDYSDNLYGDYLFIDIVDFIREINVYQNVDDLVKQLEKDKQKTINCLQLSK